MTVRRVRRAWVMIFLIRNSCHLVSDMPTRWHSINHCTGFCVYTHWQLRLPFITVHVSLRELWGKSFSLLASAFPPPGATTSASGQAIHSFGSPIRGLFAYHHFWINLCLRGSNFMKHTKSFFRMYNAWYTIWSLTLMCIIFKSLVLTSQKTWCPQYKAQPVLAVSGNHYLLWESHSCSHM